MTERDMPIPPEPMPATMPAPELSDSNGAGQPTAVKPKARPKTKAKATRPARGQRKARTKATRRKSNPTRRRSPR